MFHVKHYFDLIRSKICLTEDILQKLNELEKEYFKWNSKINISSIRDQRGFWEKHILDSQCLLTSLDTHLDILSRSDTYIYDVGTGGGFPGIVLSIFLNNPIVLIDPVNKKADYLEHMSRKLKLTNIIVERKKYEDLIFKDKSIIVSRAMGRYEALFDYLTTQNIKFEMILMLTKATIPNLNGKIIETPYKTLAENGIDSISDHLMFHVEH